VVPADGKNLNRCFPGSYEGTYTDVLARSIFDELIAPADVVIDLHGGDLVEDVAPFTLYDESGVEARARELALAFGLPYVVREAAAEGSGVGTTSLAAAAVGVPAIIPEAGGRGQLEQEAIGALVRGVQNVLYQLGMVADEPAAPPAPPRSVGRFLVLGARGGLVGASRSCGQRGARVECARLRARSLRRCSGGAARPSGRRRSVRHHESRGRGGRPGAGPRS